RQQRLVAEGAARIVAVALDLARQARERVLRIGTAVGGRIDLADAAEGVGRFILVRGGAGVGDGVAVVQVTAVGIGHVIQPAVVVRAILGERVLDRQRAAAHGPGVLLLILDELTIAVVRELDLVDDAAAVGGRAVAAGHGLGAAGAVVGR